MPDLLAATFRSLAFLTRLPSARRAFTGEHPLGVDAYAFPLAGLIAALPAVLVLLAADAAGLSALVAAVLAVAAMVFTTGALHEDGLGDVADGLGGHHGRERAIAIMKDSRVGTYGALALILSVGLRIALLAEILAVSAAGAALAWLAVAAASRGAMVWLWSSLPSADIGGLADRVGRPDRRTGQVSLGLGAALALGGGAVTAGLAGALLPLFLAGVALLAFRAFLQRRLGGQNGDCLGAAQQITEIAMLLGFALALG